MKRYLKWLPWLAAFAAGLALAIWFLAPSAPALPERVPGTDRPAGMTEVQYTGNPVLRGTVTTGPGRPSKLPGAWPRFRGADFSNIASESTPLATRWGEAGPRKLWTIDVGEGYAGPAILNGRVFLMDYDREHKQDALRCLSLDDGQEIWRFAYPVSVKRNHGMSRTVPAVTSNSVVAIGPKCHVVCVEMETGKLRWGLDLVADFGTEVPQWYTGQCPLIEGDRVILAPAGPDAMLMAVDLEKGEVQWKTPNSQEWKMSHSSIVPVEFNGRRFYIYCAAGGVVAVDAANGQLAWATDAWRISIATVPCPVDLGGGRIFLTGGYNAGSLMLQMKEAPGGIQPEIVYRLKAGVFGATQHSPVFYQGRLYGVRADGRFVCLNPDNGSVLWESEHGSNFGLGAFMLANGFLYAMNDSGRLHVIKAVPTEYELVASAQVLEGPESWGPLALVDGRLIARDLHKMVCLDLSKP